MLSSWSLLKCTCTMARKVQTQNKGTEEARGENDMGGGVGGGRGGNNRNLDGHFIRALNKIELQSLMIRAIIETNKTNKTSPLLISRGNNMIQNAVWCQSTQVNFQTSKLYELVGRVQFVVFEILQVLIYSKLHWKKHHRMLKQTKI